MCANNLSLNPFRKTKKRSSDHLYKQKCLLPPNEIFVNLLKTMLFPCFQKTHQITLYKTTENFNTTNIQNTTSNLFMNVTDIKPTRMSFAGNYCIKTEIIFLFYKLRLLLEIHQGFCQHFSS